MKYAVTSKGAPAPQGAYSQGTTAARLVFTSGQLGCDPATGELAEGAAAQAERAIANCAAILAEVGCELSDVAQATLYLTSLADTAAVDAVFAQMFPSPKPARTTVEVSALPKGALLELSCVACR